VGGAPALRRARMAWGTAPPPPSRTKWTRLVHPSVLTGHVQSGRARTAWGTGGGGGSRDHERDAAAGRRALRGSAPQRRARGGAPEGWERLARAPRGAVQHGGVHSRLGPWNLPGREPSVRGFRFGGRGLGLRALHFSPTNCLTSEICPEGEAVRGWLDRR